MVVLKKVKASSLNEVLVATVIIVVIFSVSVAILNNLMHSMIRNNKQSIETKLNELLYQYQYGNIQLPYRDTTDEWIVNIVEFKEEELAKIEFEVLSKRTNKAVVKKIISNEEN